MVKLSTVGGSTVALTWRMVGHLLCDEGHRVIAGIGDRTTLKNFLQERGASLTLARGWGGRAWYLGLLIGRDPS